MKLSILILLQIIVLIGCDIKDTEPIEENSETQNSISSSHKSERETSTFSQEETIKSRCYGKIDLNKASVEELTQIIHIDEERALEIVNNRPFIVVDSLTLIRGIFGEKLSDIKRQDLACVENIQF
ncbi:ComEA family DNA-binding protein [Anaerobacillus isosaccharinicus]|uniref:Helix-hairpin-helix domain-containing protein n=1 Tax=Anaerobacillus isosaccharinicus TaxID=1532552 RepID=A0A1S2KYD3_9BACI|nr:helix-hairpin-helix domain-containing protein [Anaerobacillus isosaccharinicus]MBA5584826.1 helix-hairpin-helix domain-containing protein [Anaerobacillus isosaccharinicus]QOY36811.1 helix-hairpin-helix domain-containing protein [Anaerobacillus isosaccharinicus]